MEKILLILLAVFAVKCDDDSSAFFLVEMPDEPRGRSLQKFQVYWNVPTMQCKSKGIPFPDLMAKYGIIQNKGDRFQGEQLTILYDPGKFPALLQNGTGWVHRNGGVPQEGDLELHLQVFRKTLEATVPETFRGLGIIDFESWRPIFRQNFGSLSPYKDVSYEVERRRHPFWPQSWVQDEAVRRFEEAGRTFMLSTLELVRKLRPHGSWGYYGFPYCFNMSPGNRRQECANRVPQENDRMSWLWEESTALFPSLYSPRDLTPEQLQRLIRGRLLEAKRVRGRSRVLPYFWYKYRDSGFITKQDLKNSLATLYKSSASGVIIWGSSNDVNTKAKCQLLLEYVETTLGPMVAQYTKTERQAREFDNFDEESEEIGQRHDGGYEEKVIENKRINKTLEIAKKIHIKTESTDSIKDPQENADSKELVDEILEDKTLVIKSVQADPHLITTSIEVANINPQIRTVSKEVAEEISKEESESRALLEEILEEMIKLQESQSTESTRLKNSFENRVNKSQAKISEENKHNITETVDKFEERVKEDLQIKNDNKENSNDDTLENAQYNVTVQPEETSRDNTYFNNNSSETLVKTQEEREYIRTQTESPKLSNPEERDDEIYSKILTSLTTKDPLLYKVDFETPTQKIKTIIEATTKVPFLEKHSFEKETHKILTITEEPTKETLKDKMDSTETSIGATADHTATEKVSSASMASYLPVLWLFSFILLLHHRHHIVSL